MKQNKKLLSIYEECLVTREILLQADLYTYTVGYTTYMQ